MVKGLFGNLFPCRFLLRNPIPFFPFPLPRGRGSIVPERANAPSGFPVTHFLVQRGCRLERAKPLSKISSSLIKEGRLKEFHPFKTNPPLSLKGEGDKGGEVNKQSLWSTFHQMLQFPGHCLPVSPSPVDTVAGGTLHILALGLENIGWHLVFHLLSAPLHQRLVAFQTDRKRLKLAIQSQSVHYLTHLPLRFITLNKNRLEPPVGYHPPSHNLGVSG